jgi:hypothetical protein
MEDEIKKLNESKINSAFVNSTKLHLTLKDRTFRNGFVQEIRADFFMFRDDVNGVEPIFFLELYHVEPAMEGRRR